jgi:hypothetical protein
MGHLTSCVAQLLAIFMCRSLDFSSLLHIKMPIIDLRLTIPFSFSFVFFFFFFFFFFIIFLLFFFFIKNFECI